MSSSKQPTTMSNSNASNGSDDLKSYVIKRNGKKSPVMFDKITARIQRLCYGLDMNYVDPIKVSQKVISGVYTGVTTTALDDLAAETCAHLTTKHSDYGILAGRIVVSSIHKSTKKRFSDVFTMMRNELLVLVNDKAKQGKQKSNCDANSNTTVAAGNVGNVDAVDKKDSLVVKRSLISDVVFSFVSNHRDELDSAIQYDRDFSFDYFGLKTLERAYLFKINGAIVERPQHMWMRVACGIHAHTNDVAAAIETYNLMSKKAFIHATPTLFNAGTAEPQLSSCFLVNMAADSIDGIFDTLKQCAKISKVAGGIGLSINNIRASGTAIRSTNGGTSSGIVPMLRVYNETARYVDQGGGKRPGSFAIYMEPWHADIFSFLDLRKNTGIEEERARDLFLALWISDLFMRRVEADQNWSLFCPDKCPGLDEVHGTEFERLYELYEKQGKANQTIKARALWTAILTSQIETGTPYMLYKDACNKKSNQKNLGTIKSSNLCTEIIEYSSPDEIAVCNLASISLPLLVEFKPMPDTPKGAVAQGTINHKELEKIVHVIVKNLNNIIDINHYPLEQAKNSNLRHRPIGIGIQGLADTFAMLLLPFASSAAKQVNRDIFETIYFAALTASCDLARLHGPYSSYKGSPASQNKLQFDLWTEHGHNHSKFDETKSQWNWKGLRESIAKYGLRNSLLVAPMPTASTSQILGNNEAFDPVMTNVFSRRTNAGSFVCINKHLMKDLIARKLWNADLKNKLVANSGSVRDIAEIPDDLKEVYKTAWEIKTRDTIDMAADRGLFIDQSQSFNVYMEQPSIATLSSMHFYGWNRGLKTGMYYLRTQAAAKAVQFTVDPLSAAATVKKVAPAVVPTASAAGSALIAAAGSALIAATTAVDSSAKTKKSPKKKWDCNGDEACVLCSS